MKKLVMIALTLVMAMGIGIGNASAANSLKQGSLGLNVDVNEGFIISGKFLVTNDIAVLGGFGIGAKGGDASGTDLGISAGIRKYLKVDDFAPFVGGTIFYSTTNDGDMKDFRLFGVFGAEYFLHKQFSIEGSVGFGYTSEETTTAGTSFKTTNLGTERFGVSFNYYFF